MKKTKISYAKRIDDYDLFDFIDDFLSISLLLASIYMIPASGGLSILSSIGIAQGLFHVKDQVINIRDYVNVEEDGTYIINEEFIQAVLTAAQNLEEQGFKNYRSCLNSSGNYVYRGISSFYENAVPNSPLVSVIYTYEGLERLACVNGWIKEIDHNFNTINISYKLYKNGKYSYSGNSYAVYYWFNDSLASDFFLTMSMPMFNTLEDAEAAYKTNNFSNALNYREKPWFSKGASYIPTYTGGSVRVSRNVIININQKISSVASNESLSTDEKIAILQEYIHTGISGDTGNDGGSGGGDSGSNGSDSDNGNSDDNDSGSSDKDYDDNKDLPPGTELSDTNLWLKKIYLKVCQIYSKNSDSSRQSVNNAAKSIEELTEMLTKSPSTITTDLDNNKGQLENISEQESSNLSGSA